MADPPDPLVLDGVMLGDIKAAIELVDDVMDSLTSPSWDEFIEEHGTPGYARLLFAALCRVKRG